MRANPLRIAIISALLLFSCAAEAAEDETDPHLGFLEYEIACLPCHGAEGGGDGPNAADLQSPPSDLTQISKHNGGTFPAEYVHEIIDGRASAEAHIVREMPVWGDRYRLYDPEDTPDDVENRAVKQINALVDYLKSIQVK